MFLPKFVSYKNHTASHYRRRHSSSSDEVTCVSRELHNEDFHNLCSSKVIRMIKLGRMRLARDVPRMEGIETRVFYWR
jgi:hypothetical protein